MIEGIKLMTLQEEGQGQRELNLAVVLPKGDDIWGVLAPLRDTPWAQEIHTIPGDVLSHALYGYCTPLIRVLGTPPGARGSRIPDEVGACSQIQTCVMRKPYCRPGPKLPDCYDAPSDDLQVSYLASVVALAWRDGRYVLLVEGAEHSF